MGKVVVGYNRRGQKTDMIQCALKRHCGPIGFLLHPFSGNGRYRLKLFFAAVRSYPVLTFAEYDIRSNWLIYKKAFLGGY